MAQRTGSRRRKTRYKLRKTVKTRGKLSIKNYLQSFKPGDKVILKAEPAVQKACYHPRFHGKTGIIQKKQGNCYQVLIKDSKKEKLQIVHPIHLKNA